MGHREKGATTAATAPLERGDLISALCEIHRSVSIRGGCMVWLAGEAGVGKTTVVRRFIELARTRVLIGACDALATPRPLGPFRDIAADGGTRVAKELAAGSAGHTVFEAMLEELSSPTLAVIEDVHWADDATLDLLRFIGRRITRTRSVVVVTYRDDEVAAHPQLLALLGDLAAELGCRRLSVDPLSLDGVCEMVAGSGIDPVKLHAVTGGNPFYLTEAIGALKWSVPPTVADAVAARASRLSPAGRAALDVVAIEPSSMDWWLAEQLGASAGGIQDAVDAGMLDVTDGVLCFRHELARLAIYDRLRTDHRRALHSAALAALGGSRVDAARLAQHGELGDAGEDVLRWARAAGDEAVAAGAHTEASAQYQRALRHAPVDDLATRACLCTQLAYELDILDRNEEALGVRQEALTLRRRLGEPAAVAAAQGDLARTLWRNGRGDDAYRTVAEAVAAVDQLRGDGPMVTAAKARALMAGARLDMLASRESAIGLADRAIEAAEAVGDQFVLARALDARGSARIALREDLGGVEDLERARRIGLEHRWDSVVALALVNLGAVLGAIRRLEPAERYLEEAFEFAQARDLDAERRYAQGWLARVRFEQGRWDEAAELITAEFERGDLSPIGPIVALTVLGRMRARRGEPGADDALGRAWALAVRTRDLQRLWPVVAGRAELHWLHGNADDTLRDDLHDVIALARKHRLRHAVGELGWWAWKLGWQPDPLDADAADVYAALVAGHTERAVEIWRAVPAPYEAALALAESGDVTELRSALDEFIALGAAPMAARVRRRLCELGVRRVRRGPRRSRGSAPADLTARQVDVLELVAGGLTNKEIAGRLHLSPRTVAHHVEAILRKLEARTRTEASTVYHVWRGRDALPAVAR